MSKQESDDDHEQRVDLLEKKLDAAFKRIESLEDQHEGGGSSGHPSGIDHHDAAVLERLEPGQTVGLQTLRR